MKASKQYIIDVLDERYLIANSEIGSQSDKEYYEGILKGLELAGYSWERDKEGNHKLFK